MDKPSDLAVMIKVLRCIKSCKTLEQAIVCFDWFGNLHCVRQLSFSDYTYLADASYTRHKQMASYRSIFMETYNSDL